MTAAEPDETAVVARLRAAGCVFAEEEARLLTEAAATSTELAALVDRRVTGFPLEHVLGWVEFRGLRIAVDPGVFVPRRRTQALVREAASSPGPVRSWWTSAAVPARWGWRWPRSSTGSNCTRPTSTRLPSPARGAT